MGRGTLRLGWRPHAPRASAAGLALLATILASAGAVAAGRLLRTTGSPLAHPPALGSLEGAPSFAASVVGDQGDGVSPDDPAGAWVGAVPQGGRTLAVPILMYHYVRVNPRIADRAGADLSVAPRDLEDQLTLLQSSHFTSVTLGQVLDAIEGRMVLPPHAFVLTFDDGYADFATQAVPAVRRHGFTATTFVVSGFLGWPGYMTAPQVRLVAVQGMTIGAHTVSHMDLATALPLVAQAEIQGSRRVLGALTGQAVTDFAYPFGKHSPAVERMVAAAGFRDAVSTVEGRIHSPAQRYALTRVRVHGGTSITGFARMMGIPLTAIPAGLLRPAPSLPPWPPGGSAAAMPRVARDRAAF